MSREIREKCESILYKDECYLIQGAVFEVYREMGCGFLESVYQECLEIELKRCGIPFCRQVVLPLAYKGATLKQAYIPDLICYGKIIIELKNKLGSINELNLRETEGNTKEIIEALLSMGFVRTEIINVIKKLPGNEMTLEQKIRKALQLMGKSK